VGLLLDTVGHHNLEVAELDRAEGLVVEGYLYSENKIISVTSYKVATYTLINIYNALQCTLMYHEL